MSICICCSSGLDPEWAEDHHRCAECYANNCTAHKAWCGIPLPNAMGGRGPIEHPPEEAVTDD